MSTLMFSHLCITGDGDVCLLLESEREYSTEVIIFSLHVGAGAINQSFECVILTSSYYILITVHII